MNFISPSGQAVYTMLDGTKRVSGSPQDGWYEATITVPQFAEQGTWKTQGISLYDQVGNRRYLTAADMEAAGLPTSFAQTGAIADASAPQLLSFTVTPDSVDTSESSRTITLTAHITDDLTGNAGDAYAGSGRR